jgi:hypothetical protein
VTITAIVEHPSWCDRVGCEVSEDQTGTHLSPLIRLEPDPLSELQATVRITKSRKSPGRPHSGHPLVELMLAFPCYDDEVEDEKCEIVLRGERAVALGRMLISAGREATPTN